jgi:hypothetical protein
MKKVIRAANYYKGLVICQFDRRWAVSSNPLKAALATSHCLVGDLLTFFLAGIPARRHDRVELDRWCENADTAPFSSVGSESHSLMVALSAPWR